jgi:hypothetical protein
MPSWLAYLFRIFYLTPQEGAAVAVAASIGNIPKGDNHVLYLQPYPVPFTKNDGTNAFKNAMRTLAEIMGPFAGARVGRPRLLVDDGGLAASETLWKACEQATKVQWPEVPVEQ